eukprot:TRINITY_DN3054_c0_g3_i1.p1 TRINITY_DN3054_c0_g3~~TRINITY_DN3054_c0_g3_i1.p1  ORF type:complete len:105 (-),score=17.15 TRINITY_DN3054_c0_g3_i1:216-530(-)
MKIKISSKRSNSTSVIEKNNIQYPRFRRDVPFLVTFYPENDERFIGKLLSITLVSKPNPITVRYIIYEDKTKQSCYKCLSDGRASLELLNRNIWEHDFSKMVLI